MSDDVLNPPMAALEWDPEQRKNYRLADFTPHYRLFNNVCRLLEHTTVLPEGVLKHINKACLIETDLMPIQIQDALDEYHVSHEEVPAFPFRDFVMLGNVGTHQPDLWPAAGALLDVQQHEDKAQASAFTLLSVQVPNDPTLVVMYMGVQFEVGRTMLHSAFDLREIHGKFDHKGVLNLAYEGKVTRDIKDVLSVWTQWIRLQLLYIDLPRHHVIVETPRSYKPPKDKQPKVTRAQDKERVRLIMPEHLRRVYPAVDTARDGNKTDREVSPHFRRGHTKLLSSSRWKDKQGQRIVVRPTWVGPEDWDFNGLKYRVVRPNERA